MPACLPACLSACLHACLSAAYLPVYLPACMPACLTACLSACMPACLPTCLFICPPACLPGRPTCLETARPALPVPCFRRLIPHSPDELSVCLLLLVRQYLLHFELRVFTPVYTCFYGCETWCHRMEEHRLKCQCVKKKRLLSSNMT